MRIGTSGSFLVFLVAALAAACGSGERNAAPPRSLLLVTIDTLRADHLGCYGYSGARTPHIDALAERGVRFETAFSVAPITFPSHVSLLTGTIPPNHGARDNGTHRAVPELLSLAEILREGGWRTAAFHSAFVLDSQFGLDQGFEVYGDVPQRMINLGDQVETRPATEVNEEAFRWLSALDASEPFFLWVHYFEPHAPYPPANQIPAAFRGRPYDAEIATADRAVGALLARLDELERAEETLVVLTSDHGESLGEHGEKTHSFFVYQGVLHVPLIFAHGSLPRGTVKAEGVSLVDVMPTALELLGSERPLLPPPGRSLTALFRGGVLEDVPVYFESLNAYLNYGWAPPHGVAIGPHKLIRVPRGELYDLSRDPREARNLYTGEPELVASLEGELDRLLEANDRPELDEAARRELTPEDRAKLASLGYVSTAFPDEGEKTLADPKDGLERLHRAESVHALFLEGRAEEGLGVLQELLAEDPDNALFNSQLGALLVAQREFDAAIPYIKRSVEKGFRSADNLSNLGICQFFTQQPRLARKTLQAALEVNAKHLTSLFWLAQVHLALGAKEDAGECLRSFTSLWQGGTDPMVEQARTQLKDLGQ